MARPKVLADSMATLKTRVTQADDAALNALAQATGESKSSHVRRSLTRYLETFDLGNPSTTSVVAQPINREQAR
jgi:hypothetical protein